MAFLLSLIAALGVSISATAATVGELLPNNTRTHLAQQASGDGVVVVREAYVWQHLYGQELVLLLDVANRGQTKEIWVRDARENATSHALWRADAVELSQGGSAALWLGFLESGRESIAVKVSGVHILTTGQRYTHVSPNEFSIYVKMDGVQYEAHTIRVGED